MSFFDEFEDKKKESVKPDYLVYKSNPLLMVRDEMAIMQARFFTAYLCKVDPDNPETYQAKFSLSAFCKMLDVDTSNIKKLKEDCRSIRKMGFDFIEYRRKHGEKIDPMLMDEISLFSRFAITGDADNGYYVEVTPTEEMKHLLLNKKKYGFLKYEARNTLVLSSKRNMRMYEFLKRHEGIGVTVDIPTLKAYLGLSVDDYPKMSDFKRDVVDKGVKELNEKTDIFISVEPGKRGRGGKILSFRFKVARNPAAASLAPTSIDDNAKADVVLNEDDIADFNSCEDFKTVESGELPGQMDIEDFLDEPSENILQNPLGLTFKNDFEKNDYAERYVDATFERKNLGEFIEFIPEDVHRYSESKTYAIFIIVKQYLPEYILPNQIDEWVMKTLNRFNNREWYPKRAEKVEHDAYGYYVDCLERWLKLNFAD